MKELILILLLSISYAAFTQEPVRQSVADAEKAALLKEINKQQKSFSCHFVEEKNIAVLDETVVSKGIITYEAAKQLTCEYTEPESLILSKDANGNLSVTKNGKPMKANMMHKQMMDIMETFVSGKAVGQSNEYEAEVWSCDKDYIVSLTPKAASRFSVIELYLNKESKRIEKTVLKETRGDCTTITMSE